MLSSLTVEQELTAAFMQLVLALARNESEFASMQAELNWVKDVLAEHGYSGPLGEACCPLREMLAKPKKKKSTKRKSNASIS